MMYSDKLPPFDLSAEEAVLGSILIDTDAMVSIASFLKPDDFYREKNLWIYETCISLLSRNEAINQITVAHDLARQDKLEAIGGAPYFSHLISQTPTSVHIEFYARIVHRLSMMRKLISASNQIAAIGYESPPDTEEAIDRAEKLLEPLRGQGSKRYLTPAEWAEWAAEYFPTLRDKEGAKVKFPFPKLNSHIGGLFPSDLVYVAARPQVGKTTLLLQMARYAGERASKVLLVSAEMAQIGVTSAILSSWTGLPTVRIKSGKYSDDELSRIIREVGRLAECGIYWYEGGRFTTDMIGDTAYQLKKHHGLDAVFVDYVQILGDKGDNQVQRITGISQRLKEIARTLDVPVIAASQLNRVAEHGDKKPRLSDLRESGSLEQDADTVLGLYRADAYPNFKDDECPSGQAHLYVLKSRLGADLSLLKLFWLSGSREYGELEERIKA